MRFEFNELVDVLLALNDSLSSPFDNKVVSLPYTGLQSAHILSLATLYFSAMLF